MTGNDAFLPDVVPSIDTTSPLLTGFETNTLLGIAKTQPVGQSLEADALTVEAETNLLEDSLEDLSEPLLETTVVTNTPVVVPLNNSLQVRSENVDEVTGVQLSALSAETVQALAEAGDSLYGDSDGDGDADNDDLQRILSARNTLADGPNDPRDLDGDERITALDGRALILHLRQNQDGDAPVISASLSNDTGLANEDGITSDPAVVGSVADDSQVTRFWAGFDDTDPESFKETASVLLADGSFAFTLEQLEQINGGTLEDGEHTLYLQAKDEWGNQTDSFELAFTLDTVGPALDISSNLEEGELVSGSRLSGALTDLGSGVAALSYRFDDGEAIDVPIGTVGDFDAELDLSDIQDGAHGLTVVATDVAGNTTSQIFNVTVASGPPVEPNVLTVLPGDHVEVDLATIFPDVSDPKFLIVNDEPLPTGMLRADGTLVFEPRPDQLGAYEFSIVADTGDTEATRNFVLNVVADPITTTRISGVIQDTDLQALAGVVVGVGDVTTTTEANGSFTLEFDGNLPGDALRIEPGQEIDGKVYPSILEKLPLLFGREVYDNVNNVVNRPIYLPALDLANVQATPESGGIRYSTSTIPGASVFVAEDTLLDSNGNPFEGTLSITEVPRDLTPAALPENLLPDLVVTIQPGEMEFTTPAPLTLTNRAGYDSGTVMDLWSINPITGDFDAVGKGRVSADGRVIETIEGGIRSSSWHFFSPPPRTPNPNDPRNPDPRCDECEKKGSFNSDVEFHSGAVIETHELTSYQSLGATRGLALTYDSLRADPQPIVHVSYDGVSGNFGPSAPFRLMAELTVQRGDFAIQLPGFAGGQYGLDGGEHFWTLPNAGNQADAALQVDLSTQESGIYTYKLNSGLYRFNGQSFTGSSAISEGKLFHINSRTSEFGSGWGLSGLQELIENPDGSVLLVDGDGSELLFETADNNDGGELLFRTLNNSEDIYISPPGDFSTLEKLADGTFRRTFKDQTVNVFNTNNQLSRIQDRNGNETQFIYNDVGLLTKVVDPTGLETTLTYANGKVTSITDPVNRTTQMEYDAAGNLIRITDPDGSFRTFEYDAEHHMTAEVDKRGNREQAFYDFAGRADKAIRKDGSEINVDPVQVQGLSQPDVTIDPFNAPEAFQLENIPQATYEDANGNSTQVELDKSGQAIFSTDEVGRRTSVARNEDNLVERSLDALGNVNQFTYDESGNLLSIEDNSRGFVSTVFWIGGSGDWNNPLNWSTGEVPDKDDLVLLDVAEEAVISYSGGAPTIASIFSTEELIFESAFTISDEAYFGNDIVVNNGTLTVNGDTTIDGRFDLNRSGRLEINDLTEINGGINLSSDTNGFLSVNAETIISGESTWATGNISGFGELVNQGQLTLSGDASRRLSVDLINEGTIVHQGGDLILSSNLTPGTLNNSSTGIYEIQSGRIVNERFTTPGAFINDGTLLKTTNAQATMTALNSQSSSVEVEAGLLRISDSRTEDSELNVADGALLEFTGTHELAGTIEGEAAGTIRLDAFFGTSVDDAVLNIIGNGLEWTSGEISGDAVTNQGLLKVQSDGVTLSAALTNEANILHEGNLRVIASSGGVVTNEADAVYEIRNGVIDVPRSHPKDTYAFNNHGIFRKTTGSLVRLVSFNNQDGIFDVEAGTLNINDGKNQDSTLNVFDGASLEFVGTHKLVGTVEGDSAGTARINTSSGTSVDDAVLNISGNGLEWASGEISGDAIINRGLLKVQSDGVSLSAALTNEANILHEGSLRVIASSGGVVTNEADAVYEIRNGVIDVPRSHPKDTYAFNNHGIFHKTTGSLVRLVSFNNQDGIFDVEAGTLNVNDGRNQNSILDVSDGALLEFVGTHKLADTVEGEAEGTIRLNAFFGTSVDNAVINIEGNGLEWTSGGITGDGIVNQGLFKVQGGSTLSTTLTNKGEVLQNGNLRLFASSGGIINNDFDGTYEIQSGKLDVPRFQVGVVNNSGTLLKTTDSTVTFVVSLNNSGVVESEGGLLDLRVPAIDSQGTFVENGGNIQFFAGLNEETELSDLQVSNVSGVPTSIQAGQTFDVSWDVENQGNNTASLTAWKDAIFISDDEILDADDIFVAARATGSGESELSPGSSYTATQTITIPETITSGNKFLLFATDWTAHNLESDETNNVQAQAVELFVPIALPRDESDEILNAEAIAVEEVDSSEELVSADSIESAEEITTASRIVVPLEPETFTTQYTYDPVFNQVTSITDELERQTLFDIDPNNGNVLKTTQVVGELGGGDDVITQFTYTNFGLVDTITDALGRVTDYDYDQFGNLSQMTFAVGTADEASQQMEYDLAGNLIASIDENGNRTAFEYDAMNRLVKTIEADPDGAGPLTSPTTLFTYDADGNLISVSDALNNSQNNVYDELGRLIETTDAEGNTTRYSYDALGNVTSITDALERKTTNQYDERNRLVQTVDADSGVTNYAYDLNDNLTSVIDANGNETEFVYDFRDRLVQTVDSLGNTIDYQYDATDNLISQTDQNGNRTTFEYDDLDRQTAIIDAEGNHTTFEYDAIGNLIALTDANGNRTTYGYDARDRQTAIIDALGQTTNTAYDGVGNITAITNALGNRTTFAYDALNRQTAITDALGNTTQTAYDAIGNITAITDALGNSTTYAYDAIYRQIGMTNALGNTTGYGYDAIGNLTAVTNALGNTTTYGYDVLNRQISITNPLGHLTQMGYDRVGNLTSLTDARGNTTTYGYDVLNRQTTVTDALGQITTTGYDGVGNITSVTDPLNHTTSFGYDKLNRQTTITDALNHTTTTTYDAVGNITTVTDALGHATTYSYDALNRQVGMTDAVGATTTTAYDAVDNITAITDPVGNVTTFGYDALNRVIAETNELNQTRTHSYDAVGNLSATTDRNGRTREFTYDALYRQTQESWLNSSGSSIRDINFTYDALGQVLIANDPDSSYSYTYDVAQRLTSVDNAGTPGAPNVLLTYTYDENGNMLTTTDTINGAVAGTTAYSYDVLNRLNQVTQSGNDVAEKRVDMTYDAASRMTGQTRYSDLAGTQLVASTDYTYDAVNRLTELSHNQGATDIATYSYTYDAANRITQIISPDGTSNYDYDNRDQLTDADYTFQTDEGYTYDDNGSRTNAGYQTGANNQLLNDGTYSYEYDDEGNRTRRTELATGVVTEYVWDYRNRLDEVITTDSSGTVLSTADYTYDVYDRRITKAVDTSGSGTLTTEHLVYDSDHIALSFDDTGDLTHRYLYGANIDQILADENAQGDILWSLTDHQGTVRDLIDSNGTVQNHLTYSSFGEITGETNSDVDHRFSYTGREFDEETEQYFYRARYYDATVGKFLSEDPIGFDAGDNNLYRYVGNSPLNQIDPTGQYGEAGHYYTVYFLSLAAGFNPDTSFKNAVYAQLSDEVYQLDAISQKIRTLLYPTSDQNTAQRDLVQQAIHSLTGGSSAWERLITRDALLNSEPGSLKIGHLLHRFGDTFAHSIIGNEDWLYPTGWGHFCDGHSPDHIYERPDLYSDYVLALFDILQNLAEKQGLNPRLSEAQIDSFSRNISSIKSESDQISRIRDLSLLLMPWPYQSELNNPGVISPLPVGMMSPYAPENDGGFLTPMSWAEFKQKYPDLVGNYNLSDINQSLHDAAAAVFRDRPGVRLF